MSSENLKKSFSHNFVRVVQTRCIKNIILICIVLTSVSLKLFSQGDVSKTRWISSKIAIDGNDKEWTQPLNCYDDNSGLMFAIGNDREDLFLCFTGNNELKMKKLMSAGWSIELSSKEKQKKFKADLIFPGVNVMGFRRSENNIEKKPANSLIKIYQLQLTKVLAKGFKSNISELTLNDKNDINIGVGADSIQHIVYEIAIPLKELFISDLIRLNELITLNVTINALERPASGEGFNANHSGMGGRRQSGGMGGMNGGWRGEGMQGGMGGMGGYRSGGEMAHQGASGNRSALFEKVSFKQKFTLSSN